MRFYRCVALVDIFLFIVLLSEGILSGLAPSLRILPIAVGFFILWIGIEAEQRAKAIKWALWYYDNRHLIADYHKKFGIIKPENATHHGKSEDHNHS